MPAFRVSTGLHVEHRRPKAGDAPHEGLLKVERREFRFKGFWVFRVQGSGFWVSGFRVQGFKGSRVQGFGCLGV